ncbi:hypothetical protein RSOLAG1IB_10057 [Rhizoctonia solani AG-1 IB]|uniref:Uncharacterized protein n=2 Tax=Thanatephorus cucumeris (strain AG1-IB / isolate 7/3/14) TaxID=1108050 RepID=A0A0B7FUT3_THACB|nr:hypothetical protein RSOLAG1IB_10057 [Rhizoctonia solani AG-1 IB]
MARSLLLYSIIIIINNLYLLTADLTRTNTYLGCIGVQAGINIPSVILGLLRIISVATEPGVGAVSKVFIIFLPGLPMLVLWGSSLIFLGIYLRLWLMLRPRLSARHIWKINTKDVFKGSLPTHAKPCSLSMLGHPRNPRIQNPAISSLRASVRRIRRYLARALFRRIEPAENKTYAFARNVLFLIAIIVIFIRAITALIQADNKIGTRNTLDVESDECIHRIKYWNDDIRVLVEHSGSDQHTSPDITVHAVRNYGIGQYPCTIQNSKLLQSNRTLEAIACSPPYSRVETFQVEVRWNNGSQLGKMHMPSIWLLNANEQPANFSSAEANAARRLIPAWTLRPGYHVDAEAKLITRRLIKSTILRDIALFGLNPLYRDISLYPIYELESTAYTNTTIATAVIHLTLRPDFLYFQNQADLNRESPDTSADNLQACSYIDDYRLSTVFDAIGSVGGLFAILQAIHVLLFGRPLLWGLSGAKLITPFGLLGGCSSTRFKQRLRQEYHGMPADHADGTGTIHITKFLRDFVIDFGPADLDPNQCPPPDTTSPAFAVDEERTADTQILLMEANTTRAQEMEDEADESTATNQERLHSIA